MPSDKSKSYVIGVETGGQHMVVAAADYSTGAILSHWECVTTSDSAATLSQIRSYIDSVVSERGKSGLAAIGVASFGPLDVSRNSKTFGYITTTPKPGWRDTDVLKALGRGSPEYEGVAYGFDTDVNAAALAELRNANKNSGLDLESAAYITVGTGIGVGLVVDGGKCLHGLLHPEAGHMKVPRSEHDATFAGCCPFHKDCVEGMAASGAIAARLGCELKSLKDIPDSDPVWEVTAHYLAHLCAATVLMASPQRIYLGGGVMKRECLFPLIRKKVVDILAGYIASDMITKNIDQYILPASFGSDTGVIGAINLALTADEQKLF